MASSIVMKVKYGDTLRRFNVQVLGDQLLDLDMEGLYAKICSLFNFPSDTALILTYVDEDLDVVTLVDDEDLHDLLRQCLNPVRINVQLNTDKPGSSVSRSSGSSTPIRSSEVRDAQPNINIGIADVLKSVPDPLRDGLLKLYLDMASKAATSSPVLAEVVENITKMGMSYLNTLPCAQSVAYNASAPNQSSEKPKETFPEKEAPSDAVESASNSKQEEDVGNKARLMVSEHLDDLSNGSRKSANLTDEARHCKLRTGCDKKKAKFIGDDSIGKSRGCSKQEKLASFAPQIAEVTVVERKEASGGFGVSSSLSPFGVNPPSQCPFAGIPVEQSQPVHPPPHSMGAMFHRGVRCDGCGAFPITGPRFKSKVKENYDLCSICFSQNANDADYIRIDFPALHRPTWSYRGFHDRMIPPVWGPHPPVPPFVRHGAMKKLSKTVHAEGPQRLRLDSRFIVDVNVIDGTIMDPKAPFTKIWRMRNNGKDTWPCGTKLLWIGGDKFSDTDSVEMQIPAEGLRVDGELDVAVDFTAPELPGRYISYWRMASPSGHKFGQRVWVLIQVDSSLKDFDWETPNGFNLNLPPVTAGLNESPLVPLLNSEPLVDVRNETHGNSSAAEDPEKPLVDVEQQDKAGDLNFTGDFLHFPFLFPPTVHSSVPNPVIGSSHLNTISEVSSPSVSYPPVGAPIPVHVPSVPNPVIGSSQLNAISQVSSPSVSCPPVGIPIPVHALSTQAPPTFPRPIIDMSEESTVTADHIGNIDINSEVLGKNDVEQTLLKELEEMGFKQVDLNKEILRLNEYNLEQSVDDLCGFSEWDLLLEELQEMGFHDREMNRRLLVKNNGSLKRVVMDLIAGEVA
ncbi:hypothetical protein Ancab_035813 [Ancistrocladus abbreviatus]